MYKLIVGLGNPGATYKHTRHNIGFLVVETLAKKEEESFLLQKKFKGEIAHIQKEQIKTILLRPSTYMNKSGESVLAVMQFYHIDPKELLVIYDDADLAFGKIRDRHSGSSGGHRGMQSIIETLKTQDIARLRIGIGRPDNPEIPLEEWVLQEWTPEEKKRLTDIIQSICDKLERA